MAIDTKHDDLKALRIDKSRRGAGQPAAWVTRFILTGIIVVMLLGLAAVAYRVLAPAMPVVEVVRATDVSSDAPGSVLTAGGYIVAHHKINVNSKVTGRIAWIGVEKGDKVKQGQVVVRLEDDEFRAQVEQARGTVAAAEARLKALEAGSRPQEIDQARHNLDQARANLVNAKVTLERMRTLFNEGVANKQQLDDAVSRYDIAEQQVNWTEKAYELARIGPRVEDIERARGELLEARGRLTYAQTLLEATQIRSPVNGTILQRTAEKGELVTAQFASGAEGGPRGSVVSLADLSDLQVELDISQDDFAKLGPKQRGVVTTDAFPDRKYEGIIDEISPEANRQKATVQVKVKILNPDDYLRPEMNAKVEFLPIEGKVQAGQTSFGVLIPSGCVRERDGRKITFVVFNGTVLVRDIRILNQRTDGYVVAGLTGGENVILNPPAELKDGDRVKVKGK